MEKENRLIAALPPDEAARLHERLAPHPLPLRERLYRTDEPIEAVYFPHVGVCSMVSYTEGGGIVEVATIGNEGFVGLPLFLGIDVSPLEAFVQVPGEGLRMEAGAFRELIDALPGLRRLLMRYTQALFVQVAQNAACLGRHPVERRCARWLLMTHDRMDSASFELTHEFLGQMLGVRRASVSEAMRRLQERGLVTYERGTVTVRDRPGLDEASCGCYRVIRHEYERLLGGAVAPGS